MAGHRPHLVIRASVDTLLGTPCVPTVELEWGATTNGKIEAFWGVLQAEVLDREHFTSLADAEAALSRFVRYYNYHRLSGTLGWVTRAERYDGTPFTDRGSRKSPLLPISQPWL